METVPSASHAGRDRLSDLPDCLLHSVLSSLGSRQVVQTSLLSRRWRHLWRSVPCLDVDQRDFILEESEPEAPGFGASAADREVYSKALNESLVREVQRQRRFEDFADVVILLHGVCPLDAYRLRVVDPDLRTDWHRWIRRGLARLPAELLLDFPYYEGPLFCFFDFASGGAGALPLASRLRRLHLSGLTLAEKFAEELRSEFTVLEDLELVNCECHYRFGHHIASRSLKRLHIRGSYNYNCMNTLGSLAVPALVSLNLDKVPLPAIEGELQFLDVASVTEPNMYAEEYRNHVLKSLRNAKVLQLRSFTTMGLLEGEPEEFREFHNLRTLILIECNIGDRCQVLWYVLQNVPNLETLVLQDCEISGHCCGESASSCRGTAFRGCKNLKSIQVKYKDHHVPHVLVAVLTQIAKDVVKADGGKTHYVGWLDWMSRVVSCTSLRQPVVAEPDNSLSDEEHESRVRKRRARKKHARDCAIKAGRRAANLARR
ncbi:hypothetical protein QYE76_053872 [Lolium multiflorum]|uniref:F-box domain-containing protein n=1 Tax=Lolium multiflorum TaxID=4521 RepID=A0AAD8SWM0_LOLMU|nr:hypothetical protein QYE76_053872 [Lolium multiflorum]